MLSLLSFVSSTTSLASILFMLMITTPTSRIKGQVIVDFSSSSNGAEDGTNSNVTVTSETTIFDNNSKRRYGVDCSFPVHYREFRCNDDRYDDNVFGLPNQRQYIYEHYMNGCYKKFGDKKGMICDESEHRRLQRNRKQPESIVNYTAYGYKKMKLPTDVYELLVHTYYSDYDTNRKEEIWNIGDTYANHWESPTYIIPIDDTNGNKKKQTSATSSSSLKKIMWSFTKNAIEQWTGLEQKPVSMYGIRQYTTGSIINSHVTRLPMVFSCIICIAQDTTTATTTSSNGSIVQWPIEIYERYGGGHALNITINPGEMLLYESSSLIHGRPFPFLGKFYSVLYVHYEPTGRTLLNHQYYHPPYLIHDSDEMKEWFHNGKNQQQSTNIEEDEISIHLKQEIQNQRLKQDNFKSQAALVAAAMGDIDSIVLLGTINPYTLHEHDDNGWQPIHEAARTGHTRIVQLLIEQYNVDVNTRTGRYGTGSTPLNLAIKKHGIHHELVQYLQSIGAKNLQYTEQEL